MFTRYSRQDSRSAAALLVCLFVVAVTSLLVLKILDTETAQFSALRNTQDYERALFLAGAAAHHAMAELEADSQWRGTVSEGRFPGNDTYSATAVDGAVDEIVIVGTGVAGDTTRKIQVTVTFD